MADAITPAFDASGKYLYFLASTNYGLTTGWLDMSSMEHVVKRSVYLAVLGANEPSPFLPSLSDESARLGVPGDSMQKSPAAAKPARGTAAPRPDTIMAVRIDFDGIERRIIPLEIPAGDLGDLTAGSAGTFFYTQAPASGERGPLQLWQYTLADRKAHPFVENVTSYIVSADAKRILYGNGGHWSIVGAEQPPKAGEGGLAIDDMETLVDPRAEWAEIYRESWRTQRELFYDAKMHGNDWQAIYDKYSAFLPYVQHRTDLAYLIKTVGGELTVGHSYLEGLGDVPDTAHTSVGLLGADYTAENGRYRIQRIYTAGSWNPRLQAPLSVPGVKVEEGDYILEVNGRSLTPPANLYSFFEGAAGKLTSVRVNTTTSMQGSWVINVMPIVDDEALRTQAWIDDNRRLVDKLSGGRLAYVWLPNTSTAGFTAFNRYFFAQQDKDGVVIDERYNQGGAVADYIIQQLSRTRMGYFAERAGKTITAPMAGIFGPKVMLINESAGSGGDALPYYFRIAKLGPLIGTRTWGGLVGTLGVPNVIDAGGITAPDLAFYDSAGRWSVENEGVAPDIEVENTAAELMRGHDAQLERGVAEAMKMLQAHPVQRTPSPAPIDRVVTAPAEHR